MYQISTTIRYYVYRIDYHVVIEGRVYDKVMIALSDASGRDAVALPLGVYETDCVLVPNDDASYSVLNVLTGEEVDVEFTFTKGSCDVDDRYRITPTQVLYGRR